MRGRAKLQKALAAYLGAGNNAWREWDATELVANASERLPLLIDQGDADEFLASQLKPELLQAACAAAGHPLLGDVLYGGAMEAGMQRQALHAFRLAFVHPVSGDAMEFLAPLPQDMRSALGEWGLGYNGL